MLKKKICFSTNKLVLQNYTKAHFDTFILACYLPLGCFWWFLYDCANATLPLVMTKPLLDNKSITLPYCPQWQITDKWIKFSSEAMSIGDKPKVAVLHGAASMKLQAVFTKRLGKVFSWYAKVPLIRSHFKLSYLYLKLIYPKYYDLCLNIAIWQGFPICIALRDLVQLTDKRKHVNMLNYNGIYYCTTRFVMEANTPDSLKTLNKC